MINTPQSDDCFLDSNIWLYALIKNGEIDKHGRAKNLILAREEEIVVSTQVINEVGVNLLRKSIMKEQEIQALIVAFYSRYRVIEIDRAILIKSSQLRDQYSFSFWDSSIVASALHADARIIFSEDMQAGLIVEGKLEIVNHFR